MVCKKCKSGNAVFNGKVRCKQRYLCKDCKYNFAENDLRNKNSDEDIAKRSLAALLYSMCKASYNFLGTKLFKVSPTTIMNWIKKYADSVEIPEVSEISKRSNLMRCGILSIQKKEKWIFKAIDCRTGKTVAYVVGNRDIATFKRLYDKFKDLKNCKFYTDCWDGFFSVLPKDRHIARKIYDFNRTK